MSIPCAEFAHTLTQLSSTGAQKLGVECLHCTAYQQLADGLSFLKTFLLRRNIPKGGF